MEIPGIGVFSVRNGVAAVHFDEFFVENVKVFVMNIQKYIINITFSLFENKKGVPKRPLSERRKKGEMTLTADRLTMLENTSGIDGKTQKFLKS